ncbi:hypothetical protein BCEP27_110012 [Burkholderia cepacia]
MKQIGYRITFAVVNIQCYAYWAAWQFVVGKGGGLNR